MMETTVVQQLVQWLEDHDIQLHEDASIQHDNLHGVFVTANAAIQHPSRVACIPKSALLSVRSCALSDHISWVPCGHGATLALAFALYSEILIGAQSLWHGYITSLPTGIVPIARLWGNPDTFTDDDGDANEAALWLHGTEVQRELMDEGATSLMGEIKQYYASEVHPVLGSMGYESDFREFLRAYSLVCSRAFMVDAFHGLSMVPLADAFNHTHENHVQLASEYDVCPTCGSLTECPHDDDENAPTSSTIDPTRSSHRLPPAAPDSDERSVDTVDMVTVRPIPAGSEIFNTYGAELGSAALLARYGFLLEGSDTDTVTFGWPGSGLVVNADWNNSEGYRMACDEATVILADSELVYSPPEEERHTPTLSINSDGQVSIGLFFWAVITSFPPEVPLDSILGLVTQTCHVLAELEGGPSDGAPKDEENSEPIHTALAGSANLLIGLCETRIARIGKKGFRGADSESIGKMLDRLPPERDKTRKALEYILCERALLEACAAAWRDTRDVVV